MAKKFRFRLDVVRRIREQTRDEKRRGVAESVMGLSAEQNRRDAWTDELRRTTEESRDRQAAERLEIAGLCGRQYYRSWLLRRIVESEQAIAAKGEELDARRAALGEASARLKAIEKLRERRWKRHLLQIRREEQAQSDEVALRKFAISGTAIGHDG